ncbi:sigma-70 family RNA polymerase sigma factor [Actinophytocola algeriensis]|jgi:RNA polymerase sigma-70 factor (ECF subfamily)|uniref:RNA polymerase sigma factor n=1 Tax=Actinophytocola algeriensis TaxID=1768010 RepID=A0A7W7Q9E5_9PSEU|nr:sigma-70 family RNA polymerase sigma factor [Actinophytocola algeriensis]MBB4909482.1 RNA polymerase sigma-70 factor (ECF subfamily) [Actinophytocola algeriensis]MBE1475472.1 RNA polymerase sigma-70 factor (ECF subfamily) [Actinophytocola algeriensis]
MSDLAADDTVTELALAAGRGDRDAANAFIRSTQRDVWRFLVYLAGASEAEDLTQETFVRALGSAHRFTARSHARTWLLAIARRVAADHFRAAAARPRIASDADWQTAADERGDRGLPGIDDTVSINLAVRTLPGDRRDAFVLTQVLGLGYAEAAQVCGCPVGTIRSRVARARRELVDVLAPDLRRAPAAGR